MRRLLLWLLPVLAGGAVIGLLPAAPAQAHAELLETDPADGSSVAVPPAEVVLRFNEPVDPPPEPVRVFDSGGVRVDAGDAGHGGDRSVLRVSLRPDLPDGAYVVAWRAISADAHPVRGSFTFAVGDITAAELAEAAPAPPDEEQTGWELAAGAARWGTYAGTLLAAGGIAFLLFAHDRTSGERDRLVRVVRGAAGAGIGGSVAGIGLQTVTVNGLGGAALGRADLWAATMTSGYGTSALLRLGGLVLLAGAAGRWAGWARPIALAGALAALGSFLFAGHTATSQPRWLAWVSNLSHTTAAAVWLGGLVLLAVVLYLRRGAADPAGGARVVARFSTLAVGSVLVAAAGGATLGWIEIRSWDGLTGTSYGQTLLAKAGLVAAVVGIGAYNNRRLVPAIAAGAGGEAGQAWRRLSRTVRWEAAALLAGVLVLTAVLVNLVPARNQVEAAEAGAAAGPYTTAEPLGADHQVELVVDPARAGTNQLHLSVRDRAGAPIGAVQQVELRFNLPAADIARITREPEPTGPGQWRHTGPELSIAGDWEVEVRVTIDDFQRVTATLVVPIAAGDHNHNHNP